MRERRSGFDRRSNEEFTYTKANINTEIDSRVDEDDLVTKNVNDEFEEQLTFGQRVADKVAAFGGSWKFIISFSVVMIVWVIINSILLAEQPFDPYPYILLNLCLSMLAAIQAPFIMLSQRRQEERDRIKNEHNFEVNRNAEKEVVMLHRKMDRLHTDLHWKMDGLHKKLNEKLDKLLPKE